MQAATLYEKDFYAWTQEQAKLIKQKVFNMVDIAHLEDELESMGASEHFPKFANGVRSKS